MSALRSFLLYFADRHTAALVVVFAIFSVIIFQCGEVGVEEVRQRRALRGVSGDEAAAVFAYELLTPTVSVAFVLLTEAEVEVLNGGPLIPLRTVAASQPEWSAESDAAMARRWRRHFPVGDITLVTVPPTFEGNPVVLHWLSYLEKLCDGCHYVALMEKGSSGGGGGSVAGRKLDGTSSLWPFCSLPTEEIIHVTGSAVAAASAAAGWDVRTLDVVALGNARRPADTTWNATLPVGCGVLVLLPPWTVRAYAEGLTSAATLLHAAPDNHIDDTSPFEAALRRMASSVDPPLPNTTTTIAGGGAPTNVGEAWRQETEGLRGIFVSVVASQVAQHLGYRPQYVLYAAWCSSSVARSYGISTGKPTALRSGQPVVHVLCLRESEVVEVNPSRQRFVRISEASLL
jgi:hypothetical protein